MAQMLKRAGVTLQPFLLVWLWACCTLVRSAFVEFSNCLENSIITSKPRILQFVPLNVTATFDTNNSSNFLNVTVYGNVTGQLYQGTYPAPDDPSWSNPNNTFGKLIDLEDGATLYTTLFTSFNVLNYNPYTASPSRFCNATVNDACPVGPAFYHNSTEINELPGYSVAHNLSSSYAFATIEVDTRIQSGSKDSRYYACVTTYVTPDIGSGLRHLLTYLPLGILVVVGLATVSAALFSPWSSIDVFRWSSNYGRDEDVLRLVTPGFGDCLQYIQFIIFTGSLSLQYPGFYQPVVSSLGWSALLFNESLVTGGNGTTPVVDGIYQYRPNSIHGLDRVTQLIGMSSSKDAWADMMVWLVVIIICVTTLTQIGLLLQWIYRQVKDVAPEDLRSKSWYFTVGNVVRIALGFFLLPLVSLSMYQFVIAPLGPTYAVALAAVVIVLVIGFTTWLTFTFVRTRPRSFLFDDLQTVLLYGPLYNTYRDDTAIFALVPILINFIRGIAIGAVQQSGIAQIILLAICEIVMILTLNAIRPYPAATSMNLYHTFFSSIRLLTILLSIAFVPSLNVSSGDRGWIGYVILLIHACVLVFGFFLNAIQTLLEVIARLAGVGANGGRDAARGGLVKVFGMRQLSRRVARRDPHTRASMGSNAQILAMHEEKGDLAMERSRTRSMSASSNLLLDANRRKRTSQGVDGSSQGRQTPDGMSTLSHLSKTLTSPGAIVGLTKQDSKDPYYRPPRRNTNDVQTVTGRPRISNTNSHDAELAEEAIDDGGEGSSQNRIDKDELDENGAELTKTKTDYAVREVDFYYGVRGPALSGSGGTRRMKTGPADPEGPVSSARGWFKNVLGGKKNENTKGFEVVRSTKAPQGPLPRAGPGVNEPYQENSLTRAIDDNASLSTAGETWTIPRTSAHPPALPAIDTGGGIELPSRIGSEASRKKKPPIDKDVPAVPPLPRKSSRRDSSTASRPEDLRQSAVTASDELPAQIYADTQHLSANQQRLPFVRSSSNRQASNRNSTAVSEVSSYMDEPVVDDEIGARRTQIIDRPSSVGFVNQHRASDNIRYSPDEAQIPHVSSVEYGFQPTAHNEVQSPEEAWSPAWNGSSAYSADGTRRFSRFRD